MKSLQILLKEIFMRERPKKRFDASSGYPTREDLAWQSDAAFELLDDMKNKMGEDVFVKHGIEIVNRYGRKHFKTREDLIKFMQEAPKKEVKTKIFIPKNFIFIDKKYTTSKLTDKNFKELTGKSKKEYFKKK